MKSDAESQSKFQKCDTAMKNIFAVSHKELKCEGNVGSNGVDHRDVVS